MFRILRQPYPIDEPASRAWWRAVLVGLFVGLFLLIFQPFDVDEWQTPNKSLKLLGFGFVSFVFTAFNFLVWPRLFPRVFKEASWTVGKAILFITGNILLIAVANRLYVAWLLDEEIHDLFSMILITFLIGIFPTAGAVIASYVVKLRQYARQAAELPVHPGVLASYSTQSADNDSTVSPGDAPKSSPTLTLVADNEKDQLTVVPDQLLYVESSDNYCTVVYVKGGQPEKPLLRSSLGRLESQINRPHIVRCHRSYVVNLDRVERVTGNAQGYKLHLFGGQFQIPVARKYNDTLVSQLKM